MGTFFVLLALYEENPSLSNTFPSQTIGIAGFDVCFDVNQKQSVSKVAAELRCHDAMLCHCNDHKTYNSKQSHGHISCVVLFLFLCNHNHSFYGQSGSELAI